MAINPDVENRIQELKSEAIQNLNKKRRIEELKSESIENLSNQKQSENNTLEAPEEYTYGQRAGQFLRGAANTYGGLLNMLKGAVKPNPKYMSPESFEKRQKIYNDALGNDFSNDYVSKIDSLYKKDLTPHDKTGKFLQGMGEFFAPFPIPIPGASGYLKSAKAIASGSARPLLSKLSKDIATSSGASAALNLTPTIFEEGSTPRLAEDIGKGIVGSSLGGKSLEYLKNPSGSKDLLAKFVSKGINPNKEILNKAQELGIEVPFNVGAGSTPANFVANNYLKSIFSSKQYKDAMINADKSVVDSVKKSLDTLGELDLKPHEASTAYREFLKSEEKALAPVANKLYDDARKSLKNTESIVPTNTLKSLQSDAVNELLNTPSPSSSQKVVINRIKEIKEKLFPSSESLPKSFLKQYSGNEKVIEAALKGFKKHNKVEISNLVNLRKSLLNTLDYDLDVRGSEAFFSRIIKDIDRDINSSSNTEFIKKYRNANNFYKKNIGERFRTDLARSVVSGKIPEDAYNLMNSVQNIKEFEKIAGETKAGKEIFDSLKKSKAREIISRTIQGDLENGALRGDSFHQLFVKGEKNQELLQSLVGKQEYNRLKDISDVGHQFFLDGRELLNTSGTAHTTSDFNKIANVSKDAARSLAYILGSSVSGGLAGGELGALVGSASAIASPWIISKMASNKDFVSKVRMYALARQAGKDKQASQIMDKIVTATKVIINERDKEDRENE